MKQLTTIKSKHGQVDIYTNEERSLLYAIPQGYISPSLVRMDLAYVEEFDKASNKKWSYLVNISGVKAVHPLNPFLLRRLKKLSNMEEYVVYTPSIVTRTFLRMGSWINKPDNIITDKEQLPSI